MTVRRLGEEARTRRRLGGERVGGGAADVMETVPPQPLDVDWIELPVVAVIDADELERARRDHRVRTLQDLADSYLERLRAEARDH